MKNGNLLGFRETLNAIGDFSRAFYFNLIIPSFGRDGFDSKTLVAYMRSTTLPAVRLKEKLVNIGNNIEISLVEQVAYDHKWDVTFLSDDGNRLRTLFYLWSTRAAAIDRLVPSTPAGYKIDGVKAQQMNRFGELVLEYTFFGVYPKSVSGVLLDHKDDKPQEFTVQFAYDYFNVMTLRTEQEDPTTDAIDDRPATGNSRNNQK